MKMKFRFKLFLLVGFSVFTCSLFAQQLNSNDPDQVNVLPEFTESSPKLYRELRERPFRDPQTGEIRWDIKDAGRAEWAARAAAKKMTSTSDLYFENRGPFNRTGRIDRLMFDPNDPAGKKVWAGANTGGLWFNNDITDPYQNWQRVESINAFGVTALEFDHSNPMNMFAAFNRYLFKSTDGGATWNQVATAPAMPGTAGGYLLTGNIGIIYDLVAVSSTEMYAATQYGISKSLDGGATWTRVLLPQTISSFPVAFQTPIGGMFNGVQAGSFMIATALHRADDGALFAAFGCGQLFKSTNGGQTWANISPTGILNDGGRTLIGLATGAGIGSSQVLYAACGNPNPGPPFANSWYKKSTDGGQTWTSLSWPNNWTQFYDNLVLKVYPGNPDLVFTASTYILKSLNGGVSSTTIGNITSAPVGQADFHDMQFSPVDPSLAVIGNDQGVMMWRNLSSANATGETRYKNLVACQVVFAAQRNIPNDPMLVANPKDQPAQLMNTTGAASSVNLSNNEGSWVTFDRDDPNMLMYCAFPLTTLRVRNVATAAEITLPAFGQFSLSPRDYDSQNNVAIAFKNIDPNVPGRVYFDVVSNVSATFGPGNNVVSTMYIDGLFASDGVSNFDDFWGVRAITFGKTPNTLFVLGWKDGIGKTALYKITNLYSGAPTVTRINVGQNWAFPSNTVAVGANDNELFVTSDIASQTENMFYTSDGGATWKPMKNIVAQSGQWTTTSGLPVAFGAYWAAFNPNDTKELFLSSYIGVVVCHDVTASVPQWEPASASMISSDCTNIDIRASDGQMLVGTFGRGVFTANLNACSDPAPSVNVQPANQYLQSGQTGVFEATVTGAVGYQWERSLNNGISWADISVADVNFTGQQTNILTVPNTNLSQNGWWLRCRLTNGCATAYTSACYLGVSCLNTAPTILTQPVGQSVFVGATATVSVTAAGATSYQWMKNHVSTNNQWVDILPSDPLFAGQQTAILELPNAQLPENATTVRCMVQNGCAVTQSNPVQILVSCQNLVPVVSQHPVSMTVTEGNTATFEVVAQFVESYSWQIFSNGQWVDILANDPNYSGQNTGLLQVLQAQLSQSGNQYRCFLGGCQYNQYSTQVTLTVQCAITAFTEQPDDQINLPVGGAAHFSIVAGPATSYVWQVKPPGILTNWQIIPNGAGIYSGQGTPDLTVSPVQATEDGNLYRCRVEYCQQFVNSDPALLTIAVASATEEANAGALSMLPNPASNWCEVSVPATHFEVKITDSKGALVHQFSNQHSFSVKSWTPGVYTVKVVSDDKVWAASLVVVR